MVSNKPYVYVYRSADFLGLGDVALAFKFAGKVSSKTLKGNKMYKGEFHYGGKIA